MTEQTVNPEQQAPKEEGPVELNINDLASMRNLIEVVTQRGAFKAAELSSVGILFDRLNRFLSAVPPTPGTEEQQEPAKGE
jgi:hypothetical protein